MGLFSRRKHQLVPKASCDDPKPSPSFCLPIVATVAKGVAHFIWSPRPPAPVGVLYLFVCRSAAKGSLRKIKVISTTQKSIQILYIIQKNPPKKLLKKWAWQGIAMLTVVMVTDWLRPPCFKMVVGLDLDTNRHGIPIPQGWITPTTKTPSGGHRTHQEALTIFVVICELQSTSWLLTGTPHSRKNSSASRKDTLLHLILSLTLRLVPNGYYIRDTSSIIKILVFLHFTYTPLLPKTPPKKYHITRFM